MLEEVPCEPGDSAEYLGTKSFRFQLIMDSSFGWTTTRRGVDQSGTGTEGMARERVH